MKDKTIPDIILRRVLPIDVASNTIDPVEAITRSQSQVIVDDVKTNGLEGFIRQSLKLKDLKNGTNIETYYF